MAYDEELAERVRDAVTDLVPDGPAVTEKRMFGGLAFLVDGHMAVAVSGQGGLLLRIDPADAEALVAGRHVRRMEMRGREMDGWLHVSDDAVATDRELSDWVRHGVAQVRTLPPKQPPARG